MTLPTVISATSTAAALPETWSPRVIGEVDDAYVKVARILGEFTWHAHAEEDELFLVLKGRLRIDFDGGSRELVEGDVLVVPKGVRHRPVAEEECHVLLVERKSTLHTGDTVTPLTRSIQEQLGRAG